MIDAVFTWVDGDDPEHVRQRARARGGATVAVDDGPHRYRDGDELRFSLRALERHAPWIGHVFLVTSGQRPRWLDPAAFGLTLITHDEIFPDPAHLPTFNSCAIEMHLHRIPGLSPRFIYFNDDFFLGSQVGPDDFISGGGQLLYLTPGVVPAPGVPVPPELAGAPLHLASLQLVNRLLDGDGPPRPRRLIPHVPILIETRVWAELAARHADAVARTSANRFRCAGDVAFAYAYTHFRLERRLPGDRVVEWPEVVVPFSLSPRGLAILLEQVRLRRPRFFCLQDEDGHDPAKDTLARRFLEHMYPRPSRYELCSAP